jgi:diguanylate cyclase (GGDEF)-like protein/PAS domain S-box-containing protein
MEPKPQRRPESSSSAEGMGDLADALVDQLPLAVVTFDREGRVLASNPETSRLLGVSAAQLRGRPLPGLAATDQAALRGILADQSRLDPPSWRLLDLAGPDAAPLALACRYAHLRGIDSDFCGLVGFFLPADHLEHALQDELRRRNQFIEAVLEHLPIGLAINSLDMSTLGYVNARFREIYGSWSGHGASDLAGFLDRLCPDPDQRHEFQQRILKNLSSGQLERMQWDDIRVRGRDGTLRTVQAINTPLPDHGLMISTVHDVTDRKLVEDALRESERRYQAMAEASPVGIFRCDHRSRCHYVNRRWREITGLTSGQAAADGWLAAVHPDEEAAVNANWQLAVQEQQIFRTECRFRRPQGRTAWVLIQAEPVFDDRQQLSGFVGSVTDISERKRSEEEIRRIAYYDTLTKLPNRAFFLEQLRRTLAAARRAQRRAALLFCDLDNFKDVNDSLGHDKGDQLLLGIAERLSACIRQGDTLSRLGGDEFVLLLPAVKSDRDAVMVARKIKEQLARPFDLDGHEVYTSPSIGIAFYPDDGETVNTLLKHADMAMYAAKARGRNRYQFFSEDMHKRAVERMQLEVGLRQAVERQEFHIVYQPQYRLASGRLEAVEALLRWRHPELGSIPPSRFIPIAEETGLIHAIGTWVLRTVCEQVKEWLTAGYPDLRVAVNLSGRQFAEPGLVETVRGILAAAELPARHLELEITESVLMHDAELAITTIEALRADGVGLTIDDFGAGHSSLMYLRNLPVNRLKLDRAFVRDIERDERNAAITAAVIGLGNSLGLDVVAEGVETAAQAQVLSRLGCPLVQGFYYARPLAREAVRRKLTGLA